MQQVGSAGHASVCPCDTVLQSALVPVMILVVIQGASYIVTYIVLQGIDPNYLRHLSSMD